MGDPLFGALAFFILIFCPVVGLIGFLFGIYAVFIAKTKVYPQFVHILSIIAVMLGTLSIGMILSPKSHAGLSVQTVAVLAIGLFYLLVAGIELRKNNQPKNSKFYFMGFFLTCLAVGYLLFKQV